MTAAMVLVSFLTALLAELSAAALGFGSAILYASGLFASLVVMRYLREF